MLQSSLLRLWMDEHESTIKQTTLTMGNLQLLTDATTKQARTTSTWGTEVGALNR